MLLIKGRREFGFTPHPALFRKAGSLMRRTILLLASMALTLLVASGVALAVVKVRGPGHDTLVGTNASDTLSGRGGDDRVYGLDGNDVISGGPGNDGMLDGLNGADVISGGAGDDFLVDGPLRESAVDTLSGGGGDDFIVADNRPASMDIVTCGSGHDIVFADTKDIVGDDCERVKVFVAF
jgi:Ca2+-binding RTX toxin-like protein